MEAVRRMTRAGTIIVLAAAMAMMISIGCSSEEPIPAERQDDGQRELVERLDQMSGEIADLREEVKESQGQPTGTTPTVATTPTATDEPPAVAATHTPTGEAPAEAPTPTKTAPPTPSGPGICGRSPEIQEAILESLDLNLCQVATEGELFRITSLGKDLRLRTVKAGDLQGLVNIEKLDLDATKVNSGAFDGMSSLKEMSLNQSQGGMCIC